MGALLLAGVDAKSIMGLEARLATRMTLAAAKLPHVRAFLQGAAGDVELGRAPYLSERGFKAVSAGSDLPEDQAAANVDALQDDSDPWGDPNDDEEDE